MILIGIINNIYMIAQVYGLPKMQLEYKICWMVYKIQNIVGLG